MSYPKLFTTPGLPRIAEEAELRQLADLHRVEGDNAGATDTQETP